MTPALPDTERKRLEAREKAQRRETKLLSLPVEPISIEGLWLLQRGVCGCLERCGPLNPNATDGDPDAIVIGHIHARRFKGWHTAENVRLQRADCNRRYSGQENKAQGTANRLTPKVLATVEKRERKERPRATTMQSRNTLKKHPKLKRTLSGAVKER